MAKTKISEFNSNPALNTDIDSINLAEGCAPSGINDAIRELMSQLKDWQSGTSNDPMVIGSSGSLTLNQGTANGVAYLNGSKVVTSGSALTFDGTNWKLGNPTTVSGYKAQIYGDLLLSSGAFGSGQTYTISLGDGNAFMQSENGQPVAFGAYNGFKWGFASTDNKTISSEWMRLTSTGLGIGTSSPSARLQTNATINTTYSATNTLAGGVISYIKNTSTTNSTDATIRLEATGSANIAAASLSAVHTGDGASALTFGTRTNAASDVTEKLRLDSSGNLGVGTTSPSRRLSVYSTSSIPARFETNTSDTKIEILTTSGTQFIQGSANNLLFGTNNTEAARIDSSGRLNVGATSFGFASRAGFRGDSTSVPTVEIQNESATGTMLTFRTNGEAQVGSITFTNTAVAYNTSSDYRLKNSVAPMTGALAKVALLKPCTYKWNADGSDGEGFIAHELAEVIPQCVTGEKDAVDENGNPKYQGIDTSFLVATLTAAIQELKAEFDAYKASHP